MHPTLEIISDDVQRHKATARLRALCTRSNAPLFVAPDWLDAAWLWQEPETDLHFAIAAADGRCVGFAALAGRRDTAFGLPVRTLQFVSVPDTQFADLAAAPGDEAKFAFALAEHLLSQRRNWDRLQLRHLCDRYQHWRLLADALQSAGISTSVEPAGINPFIDLSGTFDAYFTARSRSLKKAINLSANRLTRTGAISVEWVRDGAAVESALADALRVSAISWKHDTGNSLDQPGPRAFIERLTAHASRNGQLSLWLLRKDGKAIATEYQLIAGGNVYALRSDFDPAFAEASPGTFLNHRLLKQLFGVGLERYYMGPGSNAYKLRWTDVGEPMFQLTATSPTARGRLLQWLESSARPAARRLRERLKGAPGKEAEAAT